MKRARKRKREQEPEEEERISSKEEEDESEARTRTSGQHGIASLSAFECLPRIAVQLGTHQSDSLRILEDMKTTVLGMSNSE